MTLPEHTQPTQHARRQLYMILSPHSLPYASLAIDTLLANTEEPVHLHLITDSAADKLALEEAMHMLAPQPQHQWSVVAEDELADAEADRFGTLPNLRRFRHGHPCWRKITDPVLMGGAGEELVLLDPDLFFPNRFRFEPTPSSGLLLMWQKPNCLLPPEVVRTAITAGIPLARHVDIGVSHWRTGQDLEWVDWLIGRLGGASLPRMMHVEAIVWSAIAMHGGGGYLDPNLWVCWHRTQGKRLKRKLGADGRSILKAEAWSGMKCFHAGGEAKWWLPEARAAGELTGGVPQLTDGRITPFVELTQTRYEQEQSAKNVLKGLGYYRLFGAKST